MRFANITVRRSALLLLAVLAPTASVALPGDAWAFSIENRATDATGILVGMPARQEMDVAPGGTYHTQIQAQNAVGRDIKVTLELRDVRAATDPEAVLDIVPHAEFGASDWLTPDRTSFPLRPGDKATVGVDVHVPANASPGAHYAVIQVEMPGGTGTGSASQVSAAHGIALQLFFNIGGEPSYSGRIEDVSSRRFITHGSGSFAPVEFSYHNTGTGTDSVSGAITFRSLFGNQVKGYDFRDLVVLRGGKRQMRVVWTNVPWIGKFTPVITVKNRAGKTFKVTAPAIYVLPPWYYIAIVLATLLLPVGLTIRRRRAWRSYLEEFDDDDEWTEDDEESSP